jgi:hypothetical protein
MNLGDWIKVPDGRIGTVVFSDLTGIGIKWGKHILRKVDQDQILGLCPLFNQNRPRGYKWTPEAMLRESSMTNRLGVECVGEESLCEILGNGCELEEK